MDQSKHTPSDLAETTTPQKQQEDGRRLPTKIELTLEQSQQGVSNDVLKSYALSWKPSQGDSFCNLLDHVVARSSVIVCCKKYGDGIRYRISVVLLIGLVVNGFRLWLSPLSRFLRILLRIVLGPIITLLERVLGLNSIPYALFQPLTTVLFQPTTYIDTTLTPTKIPTVSPIIPPSPDYTPASPDYSPASDTEPDLSEDPSSDHIPPLPATSPFLSSIDDSSDSDSPDTPPLPTHEIPSVEVAPPTSQLLPASPSVYHRRVTILSPGQPMPHGRPYRYHLNRPVYMMTVRKRVGPLPTHRLAMRHLVDYCSSDQFTLDDSSRDSPSSSSSKTSSDSSTDALSDYLSSHSSSNHLSLALPLGMRSSHQLCSLVLSIPPSSAPITERPSHSSPVGPYRKRSRSPTTSVPLSSPTLGALSFVRADLLPPRKRIMSPETVTNLEDCSDESSEPSRSRGNDLEMDVDDERSDEPMIDPIETVIKACFDFADIIRGSGIDVRVEAVTVAQDEVEASARGMTMVSDDEVTHPMVPDDIPEPAQEEGAVEGTYEMLGDLVPRFHDHTVEIPGTVMSERISELERDNTRLRGMMDVARINEQIDRQVAEALEARDAARNLEPLVEGGDEQENINGNGGVNGNENRGVNGNRNGGVNRNGNGNGNENGNGNKGGNGYNFRGFMPVARECTYQDFLKCQPLDFNGTEEVVGLTRWSEKIEMVFYTSNCPQRMVPDEEDKVERFVGGLPDNIQGNVIDVEPIRLQDAIRIANNLID
ncbi:hypothetical protein Tco_1545879 [Tanacetum coccineum]